VIPPTPPEEVVPEELQDPAALAFDPDTQREFAAQALAEYRNFAAYPPWSRPADGSQEHLIDWNRVIPFQQDVFVTESEAVQAEATLDRMFARPGEPIGVLVRAWQTQPDGTEQPLVLPASAAVEVWNGESAEGSWIAIADVPLAKSGDGLVAGSFVPSHLDLDPRGDVRVLVTIATPVATVVYPLAFRFASELPVEVLGVAGDRIRDGSLEVTLDVLVRRPGPVLLQTTLFDASGRRPIAIYDAYHRDLRVGRQSVWITFFGRAIARSGEDGPYRVGAFHGIAKNEADLADELAWGEPLDRSFATHAYSARDFSAAEWDAPEKRDKIRQYEEFLTSLDR
jgi:hypothetical protein